MHVASVRLVVLSVCLGLQQLACSVCQADEPYVPEGTSSRDVRGAAAQSLPLARMNKRTQELVGDVVNNPSFFRRMPTQQIECDPQMLQFLIRRPEVLVNIWELMGITKVSADRTTQHSFRANDGAGTQCVCDLIYSDDRVHVYYGSGDYSGSMTPRKVKGRCVCVLRTRDFSASKSEPAVAGTMEIFLKLDNFGADMLTRTLGPFVGKTADYNFVETAKFVAQISQLCSHSPAAAQGLAMRLTSVDESVRHEFAGLAAQIAANAIQLPDSASPETMRLSSRRPDATATSQARQRSGSSSPAEEVSPNYFSQVSEPPELELQPARGMSISDSDGRETVDAWVPTATTPMGQPPTAIEPLKSRVVLRR